MCNLIYTLIQMSTFLDDYQLKRVISLDDLDSEYGSSVPVPDSLINEWQTDFIAFLRRVRIIPSY